MKLRLAAVAAAATVLATSFCVVTPVASAQTEGCAEGIGKNLPVVYVHGFTGTVESWTVPGSVDEAVKKEVKVWSKPFNYQKVSDKWVTDENIAPKLAREIACIAKSSRDEGGSGKVVVIGHSMGGLAAKLATTLKVNNRSVADDTALVVTIGTPHKGSILANAASLNRPFCKAANSEEGWCNPNAAIYGLSEGSQQLKDLPGFPSKVPVQAISTKVEKEFDFFGHKLKIGNDDLVVSQDSALQGMRHESQGGGKTTISCNAPGLLIVTMSGADCEHTVQLTNKKVQQAVVNAIRGYIKSTEAPDYTGEWRVHGSVIRFNADKTGEEMSSYGVCDEGPCGGLVKFTWRLEGKDLVYTVKSAQVVLYADRKPLPSETTQHLEPPGTNVTVKYLKPGLLERFGIDNQGNNYLCRQELLTTKADRDKCGA